MKKLSSLRLPIILCIILFSAILLTGCSNEQPTASNMPPIAHSDAIAPGHQGEIGIAHPANPGDPVSIQIGIINGPAEALGTPTSALKCWVYIRVKDTDGLYVGDNTMVIMTVVPEDSNTVIFYDQVIFTSGGQGIATLFIYYNSEDTFDKFDLIAQVEGPGGTIEDIAEDLVLPILGGELQLEVLPNACYFYPHQGYPVVPKIIAILKDDLLNPIPNGNILFQNDHGLYFCTDSLEAAHPLCDNWHLSGNWVDTTMTDGGGQAILFMRVEAVENTTVTPPYPGIFVPEFASAQMVVELTVSLVGTDITSDPENITIRRYP